MPIPESSRVIYANNPLKEVICQLKYPTVLRIESDVPAAFQEAIRGVYPIYKEPQPSALPEGLPTEMTRLIGSTFPLASPKVHEFATEDGIWKLTLSRDFIALSCAEYERWEHFLNHFHGPFNTLLTEYRPAFFLRVGLRYQNLIRRKGLGLENVPWNRLLRPHIAGPLNSEIAEDVDEILERVSFQLPGGHGKVTMVHGLVQEQPGGEVSYLIDNDFYIEGRISVQDATAKLNYFNGYSGRVFRWSITDILDGAMQPRVIQR
jgi:uncharacterized protein (TIGR04255 family)